jgi:hypothetical protein
MLVTIRTLVPALIVVALVASALAPAPTSAQETPATFHGTANGRDTSHAVDLRAGLVVVRAKHGGSRNFIVNLVLPTPGRDIRQGVDEGISLINAIGRYDGGAAGRVPKAGRYVVDMQASGSYEITIEQPPLSQSAEPGVLEFSGTGQQVTPVVIIPAGARRISFTHDGVNGRQMNGLAQVYFYDMEGRWVGGDIYGQLFRESGPFAGSVELEVILEGPHLFHVRASGGWVLRIE